MQHNIHRQRMRRRLDHSVRVLSELRRRCVWELRLRPRLRIHRHVQQHLAIIARRQVPHRHDCEFGHDSKRNDSARILAYPEVLNAVLGLEEIGRGEETTGRK